MENILLTIHLLIAVILVIVILLQRSEGGALGIGGSGGGGQMGLFTARGSANFLTRTTAVLATLFIASSLLLTVVGSSKTSDDNSLFEQFQESVNPPTDLSAVEVPAVGTSIELDATQDAPAVPVDQ